MSIVSAGKPVFTGKSKNYSNNIGIKQLIAGGGLFGDFGLFREISD